MTTWFQDNIVETNRLPLFCLFAGMLVGFLFIRFSVRMIRAQVKWWPGNVTPGGHHVHHVVFGTIFMLLAGVGGFALPDRALVGLCITGSLFGIGAALVLDEFALILHLQDVYWSEEGRTSVDAIFVAIAGTGLLLMGFRPLDIASDDFSNGPSVIATSIVIAIYLGLVAITLLKGKVWTGLFGVLIPLFLIFGSIRVARPRSPWARWRYKPGKRRGVAKMLRAEKRERRYRQPAIRGKDRLQNALAGKPSMPDPVAVDPPATFDADAALESGLPFDGDRAAVSSPPSPHSSVDTSSTKDTSSSVAERPDEPGRNRD